MHTIIPLTTFPDTAILRALAQSSDVSLEIHDHYLKQTWRNRYRIATANGPLQLSIPVKFSQDARSYQTVVIDYSIPWQRVHWRTLYSAYNNSPYFAYYSDEYERLFDTKFNTLMEFNLEALKLLCQHLRLPIPPHTESWISPQEFSGNDLRSWVNRNSQRNHQLPEYTQVFAEKNGFLSQASGLDLLFNLGPEANSYLLQY